MLDFDYWGTRRVEGETQGEQGKEGATLLRGKKVVRCGNGRIPLGGEIGTPQGRGIRLGPLQMPRADYTSELPPNHLHPPSTPR